MVAKDKNERKIARYLDILNFDKTWEDYTKVEEINKIFSKASKNGKGNVGKPDHVYVNEDSKLLIIIEDKNNIINHSSQSSQKAKRSYIDNCVKKAILNSDIRSTNEKIDV
ncbi:hypothetical protein HG930_000427, partial [Staphylococcus pseudintermedius]|nr:hypothetical protein [Staphylococcus pseudintermedius]